MAENPQLLSRGFMKEEQKPFYKSRVGYLLISLFVFAALILLVRRFAVSNKDTNVQVGNGMSFSISYLSTNTIIM